MNTPNTIPQNKLIIDTLLQKIVHYTKEPPLLPAVISDMCMEIYPSIALLNGYIQTDVLHRAQTAELVRIYTTLYMFVYATCTTAANNIGDLCELVPKNEGHPWSPCMVIFCTCAPLMAIADQVERMVPADSRCDQMRVVVPFRLRTILIDGCCIDRTKSTAEYSTKDIINTISLVGINWHRLRVNEDFRRFVYALLRQGMIITSRVATERFHDMRPFRTAVEGGHYSSNHDALRRFSFGLFRIAGFVLSLLNTPRVSAADFLANAIYVRAKSSRVEDDADDDDDDGLVNSDERILFDRDAMRANILKRITQLEKAPDINMELITEFNNCFVTFGDVEKFIEKRNMETIRMRDVYIVAKPSSTQYNVYKIHNRFGYSETCARHPEHDRRAYFTHITPAENIHIQNLKFYGVQLMAPANTHFWGDFTVYETAFLDRKQDVMAYEYPVIVILQHCPHVIFRRVLYECQSTEDAILVWCVLFLSYFNGVYNGESIKNFLKSVISTPVIYADHDHWVGNTIIEGALLT